MIHLEEITIYTWVLLIISSIFTMIMIDMNNRTLGIIGLCLSIFIAIVLGEFDMIKRVNNNG
jgi:tryptophan-rich sensory protein